MKLSAHVKVWSLASPPLPHHAGLGAANELIDAAVSQYVLPLTPALLADEDPMPLYALKMLGVLLEVNPGWVMPLARLGVARR